jgi:hypothetical protein
VTTTYAFVISEQALTISETETWALFGAGHIEEVVQLTSTSKSRLPPVVADMAIAHLEKRLTRFTAR